MSDPTKNDIAGYRLGKSRRDLLAEAYEAMEQVCPKASDDLSIADAVLEWMRSGGRDLRYDAEGEIFYVLGVEDDRAPYQIIPVWVPDRSKDSVLVRNLIQQWADGVARAHDVYDLETRAALVAADTEEDEAAKEAIHKFRSAAFVYLQPSEPDADGNVKPQRRTVGRLAQWKRRSGSASLHKTLVGALAARPKVLIPDASIFDADRDVLAVGNGLLHLPTGELRALRAEDYVTRRITTPYRPDAEAPRWAAFLDEVLLDERGETDPELVAWLQRLVGYGITGHTREQVFAVMAGEGSNGKGVLQDVLMELFRGISARAEMSSFEPRQKSGGAASSDMARLAGARLVFTSEGEARAKVSAATLKKLTGEDIITARHLFKGEIEFAPKFLLVMATNHDPDVDDTSEGYWRRVRLVRFRASYAEDPGPGQRAWDTGLRAHLMTNELPGILAWAVAGAQQWYAANKLGSPASVRAATQMYRDTTDRTAEFVATRLEVTGEYADRVKATTVFEAYLSWAEEEHVEHKLSQRTLYAALRSRRGIDQVKWENTQSFRGVKVLSAAELRQREVFAERAEDRHGLRLA